MASILTNVGAMVALQTLNRTNKDLMVVQDRISTGLKVANAKDNSSYWAIAATTNSDIGALNTLNQNININSASVRTARVGVENIEKLLGEIKNQLTLATSASVDHTKIANEIANLATNIQTTIDSATYNGENLLNNTQVRTLVVGISRNGGSITAIEDTLQARDFVGAAPLPPTATQATFNADGTLATAATYVAVVGPPAGSVVDFVNGIQAALTGGATGAARANMASAILTALEPVRSEVIDYAATLGATGKRLELQYDFTSKLVDALKEGVGTLVDADLDQESARLQALQVQQQLGIQALSIANSAPQNLLALFR